MDIANTNEQSSQVIPETPLVLHRRFDRFGRLVGDAAVDKLQKSHVMIIGLGGVGGWAAESLARSAVGRITIVDFDEICITNSNRQIQALTGLVGQKKASVLAERLKKINPQAQVTSIEKFYSSETSEEILGQKPDLIVDAIDNLTAKCHLLNEVRSRRISTVSAGGSAGRLDPSKIKSCDLAQTFNDPMFHQVRKQLRQQYAFPSEGNFGIEAVFSEETPSEPFGLQYDGDKGFKCVCPQGQNNLHSCEKRRVIYGSASFITGTFGFWLASRAVTNLISQNK